MLNRYYKKFIIAYVNSQSFNNEFHSPSEDDIISRIFGHQKKMPDLIGLGIKILSSLFFIHYSFLNFFFNRNIAKHISRVRKRNMFPYNRLIRFHDSLFELAKQDELIIRKKIIVKAIQKMDVYDFVIVGSGPGGSVCANKLIENGFNTCLFESGNIYPSNQISSFSYNEMLNQYKHGGVTATLGNANIAYVEGETFGGGSQINSGLYHRTPDQILDYWEKKYGLIESTPDDLDKYFSTIERDLCVSYFPDGQISKSSLKLEEGAKKLNWASQEIPRWYNYNSNESSNGIKMTMSRTYLKNYINSGGEFHSQTQVYKLKKTYDLWNLEILNNGIKSHIKSKNVILAAGTINTPNILKRSRLSPLAGRTFQMHPTIKVVALFDEEVNYEGMGVPVHQVKEFSPDISFGCSISSKTYLRIAMLDHYSNLCLVEKKWRNMAIYYAMIKPDGVGSINNIPFFKTPLVTYQLTNRDKMNLAIGIKKLCELLLKAGATQLFPSINNCKIITKPDDIESLPNTINPNQTSLMTVHLFSSCPIGENRDFCVANSFGEIFNHKGLYISDGSMLPTAPGVNPQGTIMALAYRNIEKIIGEL